MNSPPPSIYENIHQFDHPPEISLVSLIDLLNYDFTMSDDYVFGSVSFVSFF